MALDKDDIKQLIAILQKGLSDEPDNTTDSPTTKKRKTKKTTTKTNNKFVEMGFDRLHKDDIAIDKALKKGPPTPRRRRLDQLDVRCRVCGKTEKINSSLLFESPDRYKCNRCCSSPG